MALKSRDDLIKRINFVEKNIKNIKTKASSANKYQINDFDFEELEEEVISVEIILDKLLSKIKELD